ncbi:uncharacterized protein LOC113792140 [Dermatophagoides pteronyssinus]|uniref:uncharacterized protein LOC113792140 n=1 Tax=Dermatophagoides pteronyssinus TaxID=6956 RepID=UPI003F67C050
MNSIEDRQNQIKNIDHCTTFSSGHMSSSSATLAIHPHHHHFYGHEIGHHYHHQHQHHPHIQQHHYHNVQPPSSSASQMTSSSYAAANTLLSGEYPTIGSGTQSTKRCCQSCRCSNRLVTGIIITILPIAITSTLICVFMMQKTNLHQYAIYSFVIFCVAFVFPFALFFFTVVLNKLYKFYKREILSNSPTNINSLMTDSCDSESAAIGGTTISGYNISANNNNNNTNNNLNPLSPSNNGGILNRVIVTNAHHSLDTNQSPQSDHQHSHHQHQHLHHYQHSPNGLICYNTRAYHHHPYYYQIQEGTVVALAPDNTLIIEDSPPSYEMALLCPSVNTHNQSTCPNSLIDPSQMQVILPKEKQLISKHNHERSNNDDDSVDNENVEENDDDDDDGDGDINDEDDEDDNDETPKVVTSHNHLLHLHHNHNHLNHDHNHDDNEENNVQKTDNNTIVDESSESFESSERSNQEETSQSN